MGDLIEEEGQQQGINDKEHADKVRLVPCYTGNRGIADPIGCGQTAYNNVARQLTTAIQAIIARMEQQE